MIIQLYAPSPAVRDNVFGFYLRYDRRGSRPESGTLTGFESGFRRAALQTILRCLPWSRSKGHGPLATELKTIPPADLTTLAQRHGGKFPDSYVEEVLRSGVRTPAHGDSEMPIWGPLFASIRGTDAALVNIRIANLAAYIKSMQGR